MILNTLISSFLQVSGLLTHCIELVESFLTEVILLFVLELRVLVVIGALSLKLEQTLLSNFVHGSFLLLVLLLDHLLNGN